MTERTPVLVVRKGEKYVEVDKKGVRFATVSRAPKGVPVLKMAVSRPGSAAASVRRFGEGTA
ncbi:Cell division protein FtsQ OS=Streptomyces fumanus OX=67302 GN=ftsQ PE=3 SV=1 [Streptomyces fumanus]